MRRGPRQLVARRTIRVARGGRIERRAPVVGVGMDGMTILVAGLVGAGGAVIGVTLLAMSRRRLRGPARRGEPRQAAGPRSAGARPAPVATRVSGAARGADARS